MINSLISKVVVGALVFFGFPAHGVDISIPYSPEGSTSVSVVLSSNHVSAHYSDGRRQFLLSQGISKSDLLLNDFNFDGYKDLSIKIATDKGGLHSEYQFFYWNHDSKRFVIAGVFVNPQIEGVFLVEYFYGYNFSKKRYQWNANEFQIHSQLTQLDERQTEVIFYHEAKAVKSMVLDSKKLTKL